MSTEIVDPRFADLDRWPTVIAVEAMLEGQLRAIAALQPAVATIAAAADAAAARLKRGGRLVYVGAGTSGRIAVQDGVELAPTYNWPEERLVYLLAGGDAALTESAEGAEDDVEAGRRAIAEHAISATDVVIAVAASGRTPYTLAALEAAGGRGALKIGVANNPRTPILSGADFAILADTGPEIVAGSTRMKAGTAQKAALNMLSTAIMLRVGRVYGGLMVDMRVSNDKLADRARRMVATIAEVDADRAGRALSDSGNDIKLAILVARGQGVADARAALDHAAGDLRLALAGGIS
jgi:N-acetylmuramic acid 6-phosphate etherase